MIDWTADISKYQRGKPRGGSLPTEIIVHAMGEFIDQGDYDRYAPEFIGGIGLSAHAYVTPSGVVLRQVPDECVASHARGHNQHSLGVEFLVPGVHTYASFSDTISKQEWWTERQINAGGRLIQSWADKYNIQREKVLAHSAISPGRKIDPGRMFPFNDLLTQAGL